MITINWRGKTRDAIQAKMLALYEMGDVSEEAYRAFADYNTVVKIPDEAVDDVVNELEWWTDGAENIDGKTIQRKLHKIQEKR